MRGFDLSYFILFSLVYLLFLEGLLFSAGKWKGSGSGGDGRWKEAGHEMRDVLYERGFYLQ